MPSTEIELDIAILLQAFHVLFVCNAGRRETEVSTVIARRYDEAISVVSVTVIARTKDEAISVAVSRREKSEI